MSALELILSEIKASGPISFARFMELALYHPVYGYYQRRLSPIGEGGDFFTSPHIHPAFAKCIARQVVEMWQLLDQPEPFYLVDFGSGSGLLARQLLEELTGSAHLQSALRYLAIEASTARRHEAEEALGPWIRSGQATITDTPLPDLPGTALVLANEFFDALPFHRVAHTSQGLRELYVDALGDSLTEMEGPLTPEVERYFHWLGTLPPEGSQTEVNLAMLEWVRHLYHMMSRGYVLVIDYGYSTHELYAKIRPRGTAVAYFGQQYNEDLLARPGQQDITAHVDLTALSKAATEVGFQLVGQTTQAYFLAALGIGDTIAEMVASGVPEAELRATRLAIAELVWPHGLGGFKVLGFAKAAPVARLTGFSFPNQLNPGH